MTMTDETKAIFARPSVQQWMKERCAERHHLRFMVSPKAHVYALTIDDQFAVLGVPGWRNQASSNSAHWQAAWSDGRAFDEEMPTAEPAAAPADEKSRWFVVRGAEAWWARQGPAGTPCVTKQDALDIAASASGDWRVPVLDDGVEHIENVMRPEVRAFFEREGVRKEIERLHRAGADTFIAGCSKDEHELNGILVAWRGEQYCTFDTTRMKTLQNWCKRNATRVLIDKVLKEGRVLIEESSCESRAFPADHPHTQELRRRAGKVVQANPITEADVAAASVCATCKAPVAELDFAGDCVYCSHRDRVDVSLAVERQAPEPKDDYGDVGPWDARDSDYEL